MGAKTKKPKSIPEQITDNFIASLQEHKEFNENILAQLSRLAQEGKLSNSQDVSKAIRGE